MCNQVSPENWRYFLSNQWETQSKLIVTYYKIQLSFLGGLHLTTASNLAPQSMATVVSSSCEFYETEMEFWTPPLQNAGLG